jgi:predicted ATPase
MHPLHERLVGLSARALARNGRHAEAMERLRDLRLRLADELGIDPTPETVALEDDLRSGRAPTSRMPLPMAAKSFVGRQQEQTVLLAEIREPGLTTLLGGPGAGKTRLAREIAGRTTDSGRPVAWLDLAPLRPGDDVASALARVVGATGDRSIGHSAELLTGALLVLDNAEHLVDEIAPVVETLRFKATDLSILVTTQRALRLSDERVERIGSLTAAAAEQLFCDRSGAEPGPAVERICAAVDRLPLGIELAAGLTRTLSVEQLADRIDHRLRLLVRGLRDSGTRHISLRSALDWSHELLEPRLRTALRRLSAFAGGSTPEAAVFVLAGDGIDADEVAALLSDLVDRCLVTLDEGRFGLLETVREYALEQLRAAGEEDVVRRRHSDWCVELATSAGVSGAPDQRLVDGEPAVARRIRLEEANLLAAIDWLLQGANDPGRVSDIVAPLSWHWGFRGLMVRARGWLRASLAVLPAGSPQRAIALWAFEAQSRKSGRFADALQAGLECRDIYRSLGNDAGLARANQSLALTSLSLDDEYATLDYAHQAEVLARGLKRYVTLGAALNCGGLALRMLGYPVQARRMFQEAFEIWGSIRDDEGQVIAANNLGVVAVQTGDTVEGRRKALFCVRTARAIGEQIGILDGFSLLSTVEAAEGNYERAVRLIAVVRHQRKEMGSPIYLSDELEALDTAWARCHDALGMDADRLAELARHQSPDTLAAEILSS